MILKCKELSTDKESNAWSPQRKPCDLASPNLTAQATYPPHGSHLQMHSVACGQALEEPSDTIGKVAPPQRPECTSVQTPEQQRIADLIKLCAKLALKTDQMLTHIELTNAGDETNANREETNAKMCHSRAISLED